MDRQFRVGVEYARAQIFASPLVRDGDNVGNRNAVFRLPERALLLMVNAQPGRWSNTIDDQAHEVTMEVNARELQFAALNDEIQTTAADPNRRTWMFFARAGRRMHEFLGRVRYARPEVRGGRLFLTFTRDRPAVPRTADGADQESA